MHHTLKRKETHDDVTAKSGIYIIWRECKTRGVAQYELSRFRLVFAADQQSKVPKSA